MEVLLAVAVRDEEGELRKKKGDIIAMVPVGHQFSQGEISNHLIIQMTLPMDVDMDKAQVLQATYYANGVLSAEGTAMIEKRRFKIDWIKLQNLCSAAGLEVDWKAVEDVKIPYSPLVNQDSDPNNSKTVSLDTTKIAYDKYAGSLIKATDFTSIVG
jgi:hypothetical protein